MGFSYSYETPAINYLVHVENVTFYRGIDVRPGMSLNSKLPEGSQELLKKTTDDYELKKSCF
jgi:hypothetical protein